MSVHGGPEWHERDRVRRRGPGVRRRGLCGGCSSTTAAPPATASAFREALIGNPCFPETEDVKAGLDRVDRRRHRRPRARVLERLVLGRLPGVPQRRAAPGAVARDVRRDPGGRLRGGALGERAGAAGVGRRGVRAGAPIEVPDDVPRARPDDLRGPRPSSGADHRRRERLTLPGRRASRRGSTRCGRSGVEVGVHWYPAGHHANPIEEQVRHMRDDAGLLRRASEARRPPTA